MKKYLLILLALVGVTAHAASRDYAVDFDHDCMTVSGDTLDQDGDGVCEDLTGYRVYTEAGEFVTGIPEDGTRRIEFKYNAPWGRQCMKMTAHMVHPIDGSSMESAFSNTGACLDVVPGNPNSPRVLN